MELRRLLIGALGALAIAAWPTAAQQPAANDTAVIGRIIAVVGDSIITAYDLQQTLQAWQAETGRPLPTGPELEALAQQKLEEQIDQLLLLQAAARDTTLIVAPDQVAQQTEADLAQLRQRFGGDLGLQQALARSGLTMAAFREERASMIARDMLLDLFMTTIQRNRKPPPVTEQELRDFLEANRAAYGRRPPTISFRQFVLAAQPSDSALLAARALADSVFELAYGGEDFATLARRFSQDASTREQGGDLGWFQQGDMMRAFDQAAFRLRPGAVGPPVRTSHGFHIIKVERARGSERQASHILIRPEVTPEDIERTRTLATELAEAVRAGASMDSIARLYGDPDELPHVGPIPSDSMPAPYGQYLADADENEVVGPIPLEDDAGSRVPMFAVARVTDVNASGEYSLDDPLVRESLRRQLERQKLIAELLREYRQRTHIEIRSD